MQDAVIASCFVFSGNFAINDSIIIKIYTLINTVNYKYF